MGHRPFQGFFSPEGQRVQVPKCDGIESPASHCMYCLVPGTRDLIPLYLGTWTLWVNELRQAAVAAETQPFDCFAVLDFEATCEENVKMAPQETRANP